MLGFNARTKGPGQGVDEDFVDSFFEAISFVLPQVDRIFNDRLEELAHGDHIVVGDLRNGLSEFLLSKKLKGVVYVYLKHLLQLLFHLVSYGRMVQLLYPARDKWPPAQGLGARVNHSTSRHSCRGSLR